MVIGKVYKKKLKNPQTDLGIENQILGTKYKPTTFYLMGLDINNPKSCYLQSQAKSDWLNFAIICLFQKFFKVNQNYPLKFYIILTKNAH